MADKTNNKNFAKKPIEVNLKTPSDFYSPSNLQPQESCQDHSIQDIDGNLLTTYFSNTLEKFAAKQANIMDNFSEVLAENQSKNKNRISTKIEKQHNSFNENLSAYKANRSSGGTTISVNPNKKSTGAATISVNPVQHTSRANASGEENRNSDSSQGDTDMRKAKRKSLSSKCQKSKTLVRDKGEHRQPSEEDELSLYGGSDLDDQIDRLVDTPHIANAKVKRVKTVIRMTSSKILKIISIRLNKLGNP